MNRLNPGWSAGLTGFAIMLLIGVPAHAAAAGAMGAQSRADVRISVSVAPRFRLPEAAGGPGVQGARGAPPGTLIASNAPGLRVSLDRTLPDGADSRSRTSDGHRLLILVPD